jgi:Ni/Co efflux regulator RcnB
MRFLARPLALALALAVGASALAPPAWAGKHGHGHDRDRGDDDDQGRDHDHDHDHDHDRDRPPTVIYRFEDHDRVVVRDYYVHVIERGHCPPGLAKKHNGCLPPGQAKKRWAVGRPLPREVIFYELPPALIVQLQPPPPGYRYVRVASDILMIAAGTGLVAAAIEDLGHF